MVPRLYKYRQVLVVIGDTKHRYYLPGKPDQKLGLPGLSWEPWWRGWWREGVKGLLLDAQGRVVTAILLLHIPDKWWEQIQSLERKVTL